MNVVRRFDLTRIELAVHSLNGSWFVYSRDIGSPQWHFYGGPYPSENDARDWIFGIQETDV